MERTKRARPPVSGAGITQRKFTMMQARRTVPEVFNSRSCARAKLGKVRLGGCLTPCQKVKSAIAAYRRLEVLGASPQTMRRVRVRLFGEHIS